MVSQTHFVFLDTKRKQPVAAEGSPVLEPIHVRAGLTEELQLHLLKLSGTEGKVAGRNLVTEGLSDLSDTEGNLLSGSTLDILEVNKNTLSGLGTQIHRILRILGNTLEGLEH